MVTMTKRGRATIFVIGLVVLVIALNLLVSCKKKPEQQEKKKPGPVEMTTEDIKLQSVWPAGVGDQEVMLEEDLLKPNYYVIFDGSGSMEGNKLKVAKQAVGEFIKHIPMQANVGLAVFDRSGLSERAVLGEPRDSIIAQINNVRAKGRTPLKDAINLAYQKLMDQGFKQLGYGEYHLIVITDGQASEGQDPTRVVNSILSASPVVIHTIGFQIGQDHSLNQAGRILYTAANNLEELKKGLESVLAELEDFSVSVFQE